MEDLHKIFFSKKKTKTNLFQLHVILAYVLESLSDHQYLQSDPTMYSVFKNVIQIKPEY